MFKNAIRGFSRFFSTERVIILVVFLILAYGLYVYSGSKTMNIDGLDTGDYSNIGSYPATDLSADAAGVPMNGNLPHVTTSGGSSNNPVQLQNGYSAQEVASPQDLLPKDQNSQWAALNPTGQGNIATPDLLQAGYHIGLDTIGQTLRNANLQERSDPIIPKVNVGPWYQSTIEPDLGRVPLEVGCGGR